MKKTVLVNISYYVEIDESENGLSQKIQNKLRENRSLESDDSNVFLKWNQSSFRVLNPRIMNCGRCVNCGCWTTNSEKIDAIFGLDNGAFHNNKLLCDECLPPDHRWAF
ncbi:hypothetical protein HZF08_03820 [Paenibacillus sp. CGMCC 1.16610]|uniref:4Fe-4S ferredoxin-type domain-containing protein n=1 Tax=Paenibacillus anseongense TaxID=2682845 RepID=A0ABW9UCL5_9BACL|nr:MULTISPECIES: hypothetical protein [Paenibacillus]MBA2937420.1 hypothetical protein [Paenibacillus sp. CGMCC 1.16610]MVQ36478.1 hypothetical protein [Paenibacillus anseongense]